jgi:hypothetical protein
VLMAGSKNLPNMRNVAMELRKVCTQPESASCTLHAPTRRTPQPCVESLRRLPLSLSASSPFGGWLSAGDWGCQVCNHPFQCNGFQEDFQQKWIAGGGNPNHTAMLVAASGKMVLLDKLLPKLKAGGHKVQPSCE